MYKRYIISQLKYNSYFFVGLVAGLYLSLTFLPLEDNVECEWMSSGSPALEVRATTDEYEPQLNLNVKQPPKDKVKNMQRPRYYSTELGIKDKLFIGVMSSEENINTKATALNKTIAHLANKIKFFITAEVVKNNLNLSNVVGFTDTREMLKPFHVLKYIADNFLEQYDYYFIVSDVGFINGRKLADVTERISVSEDVYMGTISDGDSHYCSLDSGILLSNSVLQSIHNNLDWCVRNSYSPQHFENIGRCILHSTGLKCAEEIQGQRLGSVKLEPGWHPTPQQADVVSAYPVTSYQQVYKLHTYVSRVYLERASQEILSLRSYLVFNVNRHPEGYRNSSWPGGLRGDAGMAPPKPETRFDHLRWTSFNETHALFADDHHAVMELKGNTKKAVDMVLESALRWSAYNWPNLEPVGFVDGQWLWDPARAMTYLLLLRFRNKETQEYILKRVEVCRPLGASHVLPVPYVTESARVSLVLPIRDEYQSIASALKFMNSYREVCLKKSDKTFLMLVLVYQPDSPSKGDQDPFDVVKKLALQFSDEFKDSGGKVEWVSFRTGEMKRSLDDLYRSAGVELALNRFSKDSLVLVMIPDLDFTDDFLNRVRMNTIMGHQIFAPVPFARYDQYLNKFFVDNEGNKPTSNTGHFDNRDLRIISFYKRDFEAQRLSTPSLPQIKSDSDIQLYIDAARSQNLTKDILIKIMSNSSKIHILRAPEPGLIVHPKDHPACGDQDIECLKELEKEGFRTLNLGAKGQLAKLILESQDF